MKVTCPRCRNKFEITSSVETDANKDIVTMFRQIGDVQDSHKHLDETINKYRESLKTNEVAISEPTEELSMKINVLLESSKRCLNSVIESLFDLKNTLKNSKPAGSDTSSASNFKMDFLSIKTDKVRRSKSSERMLDDGEKVEIKKPRFTYPGDLQRKIGRPLEEGPEWGPLEYLSDDGEFKFKIADHHTDRWNDVIRKRDVMIANRSLLLPQELSGIIAWLSIKGVQTSHAGDEFKIRLFMPNLKHNEGVRLPILLSIQVLMELVNGEIYASPIHKFEVKRLNVFCEPDNFFIPFKNTRKTKLPKITLKFSI